MATPVGIDRKRVKKKLTTEEIKTNTWVIDQSGRLWKQSIIK